MDLMEMPFLPKGRPPSANIIRDEECIKPTEQLPLYHSDRRHSRCLSAATRITTVLLASWGFMSICLQAFHLIGLPSPKPDVYRPETLGSTMNLCDCGSSVQEALSEQCVYDSLATAWLAPHCRDDELTAEFDRSGPNSDGSGPYYADANGTTPIGKAQVALLGDSKSSFWSLRDWHIAYCMFYGEKYIRMREMGVVMERRFGSVAHARHCRRLIMIPTMFHKQLLEVPVMISSGINEVEDGHEHEHHHEQGQTS
ncbi:uncharacterized protein N7529_002068 [Penicillium soppii]|uniref:uncharacterized protein n=1 Tax=Penicillium soppii TaxID=69789 RepID=UPI002546F3D2|nr:uncharacterized protein N7529_002068 [Penicillium soppii]KAJ5876484.1 hypothetical protein N7529_002068 [Penicillium soppii]